MELRTYAMAHRTQLLLGASAAVAVSGLVVAGTGLGDGGGSADFGATRPQAAALAAGDPYRSPAEHTASSLFGSALTTTGKALGSALHAAIENAIANPHTPSLGGSGVSTPGGTEGRTTVQTSPPNKVTVSVTPPSYTPGKRSPSVTPPSTSGGSAPDASRDDSSVSVYFGSAPTVNPPAVDTGEGGTLNKPDVQVSTE